MAARRSLVALASSLVLVAGAAVAAPASAHGGRSPDPSAFAQHISTKNVMRHLAALQKIADRNDGNRAVLTSGYEASARYVERTLYKAGYRTHRDPFTFEEENVDAATLTENSPATAAYELDQMEYS